MKNCKTCKHWRLDEEDQHGHVAQVALGHDLDWEYLTEEAASRLHGHVVRICHHPKILFHARPERNAAAVVDGSEYFGAFLTAEDFGCVLHEGEFVEQ